MKTKTVALLFQLKGKVTWRKVREALNYTCLAVDAPVLDFRKASKTCIPLYISLLCGELKITKVSQFPLKDKKCKCGKHWLVKYEPFVTPNPPKRLK